MNLKSLSRALLYFSFFYNIVGFVSFGFPASLGQAAGLPADTPLIYVAFSSGTVLVWAFVYLFLARQQEFNRPLFWVGVIGKFNLFLALFLSYRSGEIALQTLLLGFVDLFMGAVWLAYLLSSRGSHRDA